MTGFGYEKLPGMSHVVTRHVTATRKSDKSIFSDEKSARAALASASLNNRIGVFIPLLQRPDNTRKLEIFRIGFNIGRAVVTRDGAGMVIRRRTRYLKVVTLIGPLDRLPRRIITAYPVTRAEARRTVVGWSQYNH